MKESRPDNLYASLAELPANPVTRWSAQLANPDLERAYRLHRFADDHRRALLLLVLGFAGNLLNLLLEIYTYGEGRSSSAMLAMVLAVNVLPLIGLAITMRARTPLLLESLVVATIVVGMATRLGLLTLRPDVTAMWPAVMLGIVFVVYLFLPIRLTAAVFLAIGFSLAAPLCWAWSQAGILPAEEFGRAMIALVLANALGFVTANGLQRSQRMQFAQSLVLQKLLSTDAMTGIANRRRFDEELSREWRRCERSGAPLSLLMIDVDHFKAYNDHFGHPKGDACLREIAQLLVKEVGRPGDLVARYGGEEFICLLPGVNSAGALAVGNKLADALRRADILHPRSPAGQRLTMSIGVATALDLSGDPASLVSLADQLLYVAKDAGRNQIAVQQQEPAKRAARVA